MTFRTSFETWEEPFDPDDSKGYTFEWDLDPGVSIVSAVVDIVDPTSQAVDLTSDLSPSAVTYGQIEDEPTRWGVTWRPVGGTAPSDPRRFKPYYARCHMMTSNSPDAFTMTMILKVQQQ